LAGTDSIIVARTGDRVLINKIYVVVRTEKGQELGWLGKVTRVLTRARRGATPPEECGFAG